MNIENKTILITGTACRYASAASNEVEVHRRDICAQHASQAQPVVVAGAGSTGGILVVCISKFRKLFRASGLGLFQKMKEK